MLCFISEKYDRDDTAAVADWAVSLSDACTRHTFGPRPHQP